MKTVNVGDIKVGGTNPLVLLAGPCVIENKKSALYHAKMIKEIAKRVDIPFIFKSSYDKANRSSVHSYRGVGLKKGIAILNEIKNKLNIPVLSDVHSVEEINEVSEVLDIIQIPAFLCRQTDILLAAGKTRRVINVKKGQFLAPEDMLNVIEKICSTGNNNILLTERGSCFGYHNLVSDLRSLPIMRRFGYPVIYDATHSIQLPGGKGTSSGGERQFVAGLSRAAVAMGVNGLFLEVHQNPANAPCDGPNMLYLSSLEGLLREVKEIDRIVKRALKNS